jgi:hypothetical protein
MYELHITNKTGRTLFITGHEGSDWTNVSKNGIAPNGSALVAQMTPPTQGASDHWGWIFFDLHSPRGKGLQAYMAAGTSRGVFDYCVQYGDGGNNRTGGTIAGTTARTSGNKVILTIEHVFDPWMSRIDPARPLHRITIPGSHDSATHELLYPSKTHNAVLAEQLYMGVRHFDIRLDSNTKNLRVVHGGTQGSGNTSYGLADVVAVLRDFLFGKNGLPSTQETVVLQLKVDRNTDAGIHGQVTKILKNAFKDDPTRLHTDPIVQGFVPGIGKLRGKLVLLRRYETPQEDAQGSGTSIKYFALEKSWNDWQANPRGRRWIDVFNAAHFEWPDGGADPKGLRNRHGLPFVIQDDYRAAPAAKTPLVLQFLEAAGKGTLPEAWYLNFASTADPGKSAEQINPQIRNWLASHAQPGNQHGYGTILMDFVDLPTAQAVIAANF